MFLWVLPYSVVQIVAHVSEDSVELDKVRGSPRRPPGSTSDMISRAPSHRSVRGRRPSGESALPGMHAGEEPHREIRSEGGDLVGEGKPRRSGSSAGVVDRQPTGGERAEGVARRGRSQSPASQKRRSSEGVANNPILSQAPSRQLSGLSDISAITGLSQHRLPTQLKLDLLDEKRKKRAQDKKPLRHRSRDQPSPDQRGVEKQASNTK